MENGSVGLKSRNKLSFAKRELLRDYVMQVYKSGKFMSDQEIRDSFGAFPDGRQPSKYHVTIARRALNIDCVRDANGEFKAFKRRYERKFPVARKQHEAPVNHETNPASVSLKQVETTLCAALKLFTSYASQERSRLS